MWSKAPWTSKFMTHPWFSPQEACSWFHEVRFTNTAWRGDLTIRPIGNTYFIENICERDAKLFFTQARKVAMNREELAARAEVAAELQRRKSVVRSSSVGPPPKLSTLNGRASSWPTSMGKFNPTGEFFLLRRKELYYFKLITSLFLVIRG